MKEEIMRPLVLVGQALKSGRLHHALLVTGGLPHLRKQEAEAIAAIILCDSPMISKTDSEQENTGSFPVCAACGQCASCRKVAHGTHPDLIVLEPEGDRAITISRIRDIQASLSFSPLNRRARVVLIHQVEKMSLDSANAFLKTLEEPPVHNYMILTAESSAQLLDTVVSRCQELRMAVNAHGELTEDLPEAEGDETPQHGRLLDKEQLIHQAFNAFLDAVVDSNLVPAVFSLKKRFSADNIETLALLAAMEMLVRDLLLLKSSVDIPERLLISDMSQKRALSILAEAVNCDSLIHYQQELVKLNRMVERNVNRELVLMRALLFWTDQLTCHQRHETGV